MMQRCKTRVPGSTIEPNIMSQTIPYCPICRKNRDTELEAIRSKPKSKGKGKAQWGSESEDEESEWGGGEPGIMKVRDLRSEIDRN
jgi:NAD-dependent histone deacetylase SIR2